MPLSEIDKFKYLLKYKNESFLFPFDFVYDEENFYGYITQKSFGKKLCNNFSNLNIEKLSTHSVLLEDNIKKVSQGKITLEDVNETNIMYDGEKLEVIDFDFYWINEKSSFEKIHKINSNSYKITILEQFRANIYHNPKTIYILDKITKYEYMSINASDAMIRIKEEVEKYYKEKIDTIDDLNTILRR